jgi:hypothetical protein
MPGKAGRENNWMQNREGMKADGLFSGLQLFIPEDVAVAESMGGIYDRTEENLVAADLAIVRIRRILLEMARDVLDEQQPIGRRTPVDTADIYCRDVVLEEGQAWQDVAIPPQFRERQPQNA